MSTEPRTIETGFLCERCLEPLPDSPPLAEDWRVTVGRTKRLCPKCKKIRTSYWKKPIPTDRYDWEAWFDGEEETHRVGYGRTEEEAINELKEEYDDD